MGSAEGSSSGTLVKRTVLSEVLFYLQDTCQLGSKRFGKNRFGKHPGFFLMVFQGGKRPHLKAMTNMLWGPSSDKLVTGMAHFGVTSVISAISHNAF